ncbi:MAG: VOC family protein [Rhodospirillaceae bacterium]|nr:VOC family protein [Rhodospirillaceae bacterium]
MQGSVQGLGWFVRRTSDAAILGKFYRDALGLPVLRHWALPENAGYMLYAGGVTTFEANRGGQIPISDPLQAECIPIFRARDLKAAMADAISASARLIGEDTSTNISTKLFADALGHLFGLRAANDQSTLAPDIEAARAWRAGERGLAGLSPMPDAIQDLGTIRPRVEDPKNLAEFYAEMLGLDIMGEPTSLGASLHLGGTGILELVPGGTRRSPPKDRVDVTDVWILRVHDYVGLKAHFAVNRVQRVNSLEMAGGWLDYYTDPEGHLFGFQERKPPDPKVPNTNLIEDIAARKQWEAS